MPTTQEEKMNRVSGDIIHKESRLGIPLLIVEVYDIDPVLYYENPDPDKNLYVTPGKLLQEERFEISDADTAKKRQGLPGDRLGSVLTDQVGHFELIYGNLTFWRGKLLLWRSRKDNLVGNCKLGSIGNRYIIAQKEHYYCYQDKDKSADC